MAGLQNYLSNLQQISSADALLSDSIAILQNSISQMAIVGNQFKSTATYLSSDPVSIEALRNDNGPKTLFNLEYGKPLEDNLYRSGYKDEAANIYVYAAPGDIFTDTPSILNDVRQDGSQPEVTQPRFVQFKGQLMDSVNNAKANTVFLNNNGTIYSPAEGSSYALIGGVNQIDFSGEAIVPNFIAQKSMMNFSFAADNSGKMITTATNPFESVIEDYLRLVALNQVIMPTTVVTQIRSFIENGNVDAAYQLFNQTDALGNRIPGGNPLQRWFKGQQYGQSRALVRDDIVNTYLPHLASLAQLNPRFNRYINPLFYLGIEDATQLPFLDLYKSTVNTSQIDTEQALVVADWPQKISQQPSVYIIPSDQLQTPKQYDELIVHVGAQAYPSYFASLVPDAKLTAINLINMANNSLDSILGGAGQDINNAIAFSTGMNPDILKDQLVGNLDTKLSAGTNSENPFFGAKYGLNIGQTTGNFFTPSMQGFKASKAASNVNPGGPTYALAQQVDDLLNGKSSPNPMPDVDSLVEWFLPYTDPTQYNLDERFKYGGRGAPSNNDFKSLLSTLSNLGNKNDGTAGIISGIANTITNLNNDLVQLGDNISNLGAIKLPPQNNESSFFLDKFLPTQDQGTGIDVWDKTIDVVLQGSDAVDQRLPWFAAETHREFVDAMPWTQIGKEWIVSKDQLFEQQNSYTSNIIQDIWGDLKFPNIKSAQPGNGFNAALIQATKLSASGDGLIFEGTQQIDGSYNGVDYSANGFDPGSAQPNLEDNTYLNHVQGSRIDALLNVTKGQLKSYDMDPATLAVEEVQWFPFWFRTIARDDFAVIQQPVYQNGAVFMTKRRVTGNSIVFFDASIEGLQESYQMMLDKEFYTGRTDPVYFYRNTTRSISFSFNLYAASPIDVASNHQKLLTMCQMMYPQLMTINEIGSIGFRRGPVVEFRMGDLFLMQGFIESMSIEHGAQSQIWTEIPGGRVLRDLKININFALIHAEQPNASTQLYSPTFLPQVFKQLQADGTFQPY